VELLKRSEEAKDYDVQKAKQERDGLLSHYEALLKKQHQVHAASIIFRTVFRIRTGIHLIRIRIGIQSGSRVFMTQNLKNLQLKKINFFLDQKLQFTYP
jgi:hypothetical protein